MKKQKQNKVWLESLHRWLTGEARLEDERKLENLAKEDSFLAEALEGFRSLPQDDHAATITRLKANLRRKAQKQRGLYFYLLRAAAVATLLVAAWFVVHQFYSEEKLQDGISEAARQSQELTEENLPAPVAEHSVAEPAAHSMDTNLQKENAPYGDLARTSRSKPPPDKTTSPHVASSQPAEISEPPGFFTPGDSGKTEIATARERQEAPGNLSQNAEVLDGAEAKEPLWAKARKSHPGPPAPVGGFKNFEKYIGENLHRPAAAVTAGVGGTVILRFQIRANGRPADFEIVRSSGHGWEEEAIRLLKEGPDWEAAPGAVATYSFKFE